MLHLPVKFKRAKELETEYQFTFSLKKEDFDELAVNQQVGKDGYFCFDSDPIRDAVKEAVADKRLGTGDVGKTHSQRLRAVIVQWALQEGKDPDKVYSQAMLKFTAQVQSYLK